ncbi:MAG: PAS domain S-box protein [Anaerolineae bacterium]
MTRPDDHSLEERVLVVAPTAGDAAVSRSVLAEAGMVCCICADIAELCLSFQDGAGAILLTEESLAEGGADRLVETLWHQPTWSDVPVVLLTDRGADSPAAMWIMDLLSNVTILERPVRMITLISTLRTALKARRRQYELRNQTEALRSSEENFRSMFAVSSVGMAQADIATRHFLRVNAAFCRITGYSEAELLALNVDELNHPDDRPEDNERFMRLVRGETLDYRSEKRYIRKGGSIIWVLASGNIIRDADGRPLWAWAVVQDITARKEAEEALHEADRRKDEFLATLAHELRNPLAPILTATEILRRKGPPDPILQRSRDVIDRQVRHMTRLIDDLLDVSRITRNRLELRRERVELAAVCGQRSRRAGHSSTATGISSP